MLRTSLCALILLLHGCIDTHATDDGDDATPRADGAVSDAEGIDAGDARLADASPTDARPADARPTDASPGDASPTDASPTDASPADALPADAGPPLTACEEAITWARAGGTEPQACTPLPDNCHAPVNPCCDVFFHCEDGQILRQVTCDDSCAQGCSTYTQDDCALDPTCAWFDSGACGPGPEGTIEGPICAPRPLGPCGAGGTCPENERCLDFLINPCLGEECDACAAVVQVCVRGV